MSTEIKPGEWDKLWTMLKAQSIKLPCEDFVEYLERYATVRLALMDLPGVTGIHGFGRINARAARFYFYEGGGIDVEQYVIPFKDRFRAHGRFAPILGRNWNQPFTEDQVDRILKRIRKLLDVTVPDG